MSATNTAARDAARDHLTVVFPARRPLSADRNAALAQVRRARRQLLGHNREGRFAHLKRMYD